MNDFLETVVAAALSNALVATALAAAALVASRWAKPTVAHALWLLVLVKLVTPPLFEAGVPLPAAVVSRETSPQPKKAIPADPLLSEVAPRIVVEKSIVHAVPTDSTGQEEPNEIPPATDDDPFVDEMIVPREDAVVPLPTVDEPSTLVATEPPSLGVFDDPPAPQAFDIAAPRTEQFDTEQPSTVAPAIEAVYVQQPAKPPALLAASATPETNVVDNNAAINVAPLLLAVWATGSITWFALALVRIVRFRRVLRHAIPATPPLQAEVAAIADEIGLRRAPDVLIVPGQVSPLVCTPLCRAVLVLPRDLLARFSAEQRAAVIAHELAHLRRRDHWARWLEVVCIACYWWLPTVWLARRQLHAAEEACCDAWVIWLLPERSRDYARALLETVDFLTPASDVPLLASGFSRASTLKRRFDMILRQRASHRLSWPARVGVAAASLLILPWSLTTLSADDTDAPSATNPATPPVTPAAGLPPSANDAPVPGLPTPDAPPSTDNLTEPLPPTQPPSDTVQLPPTTPRLPPTVSNAPAATPPDIGLPLTAPRATLPPSTVVTSAAGVMARLERLEATTAELLMLVKQLRAEQQGTRPTPKFSPARYGEDLRTHFNAPYIHGDRQLNIEVNGSQIIATDTESQKKLWVAPMPWRVASVQATSAPGAAGKILAIATDGNAALLDPDTGEIKASNKLSDTNPYATPAVSLPGPPSIKPAPSRKPSVSGYDVGRTSSPSTTNTAALADAAARAEQVAKIELEMLAMERKLAHDRADLQHQLRQKETHRARAARKLDALTEDASSDNRLKLTAELEEAEDQLAAFQYKVDTFEADLEFKIRELQIRRNQMLRTSEPAEKDGSSIDRGNDSTDTVATQDTGLRVEASNVSNPVLMNEELSYFVTVQNLGNQTESDVVVEIELPEGVELPNVQSLHKYERSGGKISFSPIESLRPRAQETFVIRARPTREGKYRLVASVRSGKSLSTQIDQAETTVTEAIRR
jgi:beta-lactamase regulating signal transducer with metallopeptidase domain